MATTAVASGAAHERDSCTAGDTRQRTQVSHQRADETLNKQKNRKKNQQTHAGRRFCFHPKARAKIQEKKITQRLQHKNKSNKKTKKPAQKDKRTDISKATPRHANPLHTAQQLSTTYTSTGHHQPHAPDPGPSGSGARWRSTGDKCRRTPPSAATGRPPRGRPP